MFDLRRSDNVIDSGSEVVNSAQVNFSSPWEKIYVNLPIQFNQTLPDLTLPNNIFDIPWPNTAGASLPLRCQEPPYP